MSQLEVYAGLEPRGVWRHFAALNGIPRPSGREAAAREYARGLAEQHGASWAVDARGNLVVRVPATPGCEQAPAVAVQAHLDMVCEKRPDVEHDFSRDPIRPRREGDFIYATGTTLGADNGIGAAAALALLTQPGLKHGPLELLFTVEEETGLHGAAHLYPSLLRTGMLINLDSEDPEELIIGCAGGVGAILRAPFPRAETPGEGAYFVLTVGGLKGGHSGIQIHQPLANAIKLLAGALHQALEAGVPLRLADLRGGNAHNAIPRDASAVVFVPPAAAEPLRSVVTSAREGYAEAWSVHEPGFSLEMRPLPAANPVAPADVSAQLVRLLDALPHGVQAMSPVFPETVETSTNLAQVDTMEEELVITTSSRSFNSLALGELQAHIRALGEAHGARIEERDGYAGWEPSPDSKLLATTARVYERLFQEQPKVLVIHAGLECGVIADKRPGMEAISFGPLIQGAHTPEERVLVPTVGRTWALLTALLAELAS